ncbi:ribokinase [Coleophoma crateriformis]|uniref:Ribokinase n=1 Tax=Coleophoma crateriformis TaxID=565419 RepID=A0A3D8T9B7_9HELO|nr:ribokinase [Coleophoma crateriformis]
MGSQKIISVIGSLNTDLVTLTPYVPSGGETMTATSFSTGPGGKGANQAVATARLSQTNPHVSSDSEKSKQAPSDILVKMVGAVGADEFGPTLISSMKHDGIDINSVKVVEGTTTGVAVILVEEKTGENRILLNPGANHSLRPEDFEDISSFGTPAPDLIILQLEIPLDTVLQILNTAKRAGIEVLLNPAPAVPLPDEIYTAITHLIVNETEAALLSETTVEEVEQTGADWGRVAQKFIKKGVKNVVVTLGAKGAIFADVTNTSGQLQSGEKVKVVDTTAAGDTFVGAYALEVVRRQGNKGTPEQSFEIMSKAVQRACKAAGKTCEKKGAQSAIPWADEV